MIDLERCTGCKSCEAACKQTNALGPEQLPQPRHVVRSSNSSRTTIQTLRRGSIFSPLPASSVNAPLACARARCYPKAISKDPVDRGCLDQRKPLHRLRRMRAVLPLRRHRLQRRASTTRLNATSAPRAARSDLGPACAFVCPTRAISYGKRADLLAQAESPKDRELLDTDHFLQDSRRRFTCAVLRDAGQRREVADETRVRCTGADVAITMSRVSA